MHAYPVHAFMGIILSEMLMWTHKKILIDLVKTPGHICRNTFFAKLQTSSLNLTELKWFLGL